MFSIYEYAVKPERRKQERSKVKGETYIYSASSFTLVGRGIDVSRSGISFSYIAGYDLVPAIIDDLGILISRLGTISENLSFQIVYCRALPSPPASNVLIRRCGGRFLSLTSEQEGEIKQLIARHTKKE